MADSIRVSKLNKTYTQPTTVVALRDLNLTVECGEVVGLLGENGAGKTTLIKILATLLLPDSGTVVVAGHDVVTQGKMVRESIGYVGQDSDKSAYWRLTARQNLIYFAAALRGMKRRDIENKIDELASKLEFSNKIDREFSSLSGGEKQMVIIMRALVHSPQVILMDEPSKSLDPANARLVQNFLKKYVKESEASLVLTTHNMQEAERLCDRLIFLHAGRIVYEGTPSEFRRVVTEDVITLEANLDRFSNELENLPGVVRVSVEGNTRIATNELVTTIPALTRFLERHSLRVNLRVQSPSLEDAYLLLTTRVEGAIDERVPSIG